MKNLIHNSQDFFDQLERFLLKERVPILN